jgi:hypothetical protein
VIGHNGVDIQQKWKSAEGPSSYLGIVSNELPNFFMFFGPHAVIYYTYLLDYAFTCILKVYLKYSVEGAYSQRPHRDD